MVSRENYVRDNWRKASVQQIAVSLGTTTSAVYRIATRLRLPNQKSLREELVGPSEGEIKERAAEIRKGWSAAEERRRRIGPGSRYEIPCFKRMQIFPEFQGQGR